MSTTSAGAAPSLRTCVCTRTVAPVAVARGVVTNVLQSGTWTGPVVTSQTLRSMPAPEYQREQG